MSWESLATGKEVGIERTATFSPCRKYRYTLWRYWGGLFASGYAMFIGLNSSTADEKNDDPTIRRCMGYANDWGYAGIYMGNLFGYQATNPEDMKTAEDPVGPDNDRFLLDMAKDAGIIIAAWGVHGAYRQRDKQVIKMFPELHCLKLTKDRHPAHPLYLPAKLKPIPFTIRRLNA